MVGDEMLRGISPNASRLERALVALLAASPQMVPDDLAGSVRSAASHLGGHDTEMLLVDLAQLELCTMDVPDDGRSTSAVDTSAAGEAFRRETFVRTDVDGGVRICVPILDSAERLGVLVTTIESTDEHSERQWAIFAGLVGELIVAKSRYGDRLARTRRRVPITIAAEMRWSLLPPLTFTSPRVVVSGILEPAYGIAGDTFDYAVNGSVAHVALFDAMGHGLEASRMANLAVGCYRNCRRRDDDLVATAHAIDHAIETQFGEAKFVTGQLATLDLDTGSISTINAGHPVPVLFNANGSWKELPCARTLPFGLGGISDGEPATVQMASGDIVLFHTDGITEARSATGEFFGDERLRQLVRELLTTDVRPAEVLRQVVMDLLAHRPALRDDASLVLLGWNVGERVVAPLVRD